MTRPPPSRFLLAALLVLSLAANAALAVLWLRARDGAEAERRVAAQAARRSENTAAMNTALAECGRRLQAGDAARAIGLLLSGRAAQGRDVREDAEADAGPRSGRDLLCRIARNQAMSAWAEKRDEIVQSLRRSLPDAAEQERNVKGMADKLAGVLGLDEQDRARFERSYREPRLRRMGRISEIVSRDPVDYAAVLEEANGLSADEDRIARELFGEDAARRLADEEREGRATILALIASLGDLSWDEAIREP